MTGFLPGEFVRVTIDGRVVAVGAEGHDDDITAIVKVSTYDAGGSEYFITLPSEWTSVRFDRTATDLDPEITITGLRGRVAELIDTRDRLTRERDDARDEVVQLCKELLQLRQALAAATAERDQARAVISDSARHFAGPDATLAQLITTEQELYQADLAARDLDLEELTARHREFLGHGARLEGQLKEARAALDHIKETHGRPRTDRHGSGCINCAIVWPCPTYLAAGGKRDGT